MVLVVTLDEQLKTEASVFCIVFSSAVWEQQFKRERDRESSASELHPNNEQKLSAIAKKIL